MRRRHRLSTISSDLNDEPNDNSPRQSFNQRRRKSSNFDMLANPFMYQDYIKSYLDGIDEEEEQKYAHGPSSRKRTRSSNYLQQKNNAPLLEEESPFQAPIKLTT